MLWQLGVLADWRETPPPMAGSFLLLGKGLSGSMSLIYKPTNPKLWPQPHPYLTFTHQANISPALNHPQARYQTTIDHLSTPKPTRIIQTDQSQAVYPAMPFISWRNPQKVCGLSLPPCSFLPPYQHGHFPLWPCMACVNPLSGTCEYSKSPFKHGSFLLWPYQLCYSTLNTYILTICSFHFP